MKLPRFIIAAIVSLTLMPLTAVFGETQEPGEKPVAAGMVIEGRITLPDGSQFTAPDATWEWCVLSIGEVKMFVLAKMGEKSRISIMHQPVEHVDDVFMRGFVRGLAVGTLRKKTAQGIQVDEPRFARSDFPVQGTYRFEADMKHPNGVTSRRAGYVLPTGHVVMMSFQGSNEPPELKRVTASFRKK